MKTKIIVLGSGGMLGHMVKMYFQKMNYDVVCIEERYSHSEKEKFAKSIKTAGPGFIINCIGKIPQKHNTLQSYYNLNAVLPLYIADSQLNSQFLIHPSTDCVFNGEKSAPYPSSYLPNAKDEYGRSKIIAENYLSKNKRAKIFRVSIIGPENNEETLNGKGLMAWFLTHQDGEKVKGYTNHYWNGITTLEWCKRVELFIKEFIAQSYNCDLLQLGTTNIYSKYQILCLLQKTFNTRFDIEPVCHSVTLNRSLIPDDICCPLENQLIDLATFIKKSK